MAKFEASSSPHSAGQVDGRKKTTAFGVSIRAKLGLAMNWQKVKPVPERWKQIAFPRGGRIQIERGRERSDGHRRDVITQLFRTADPGL
jgi:hypothetical protein